MVLHWRPLDVQIFGTDPSVISVEKLYIIKRPARDAFLYMGESTLPDPADPHFLFAIASQP